MAMNSFSNQLAAHQVGDKEDDDDTIQLVSNRIFYKNATILSIFFLAGEITVGMHVFKNRNSLRLPDDYAPKYLVDTTLYVFVILVLLCMRIFKDYGLNIHKKVPKLYTKV